MCFVAAFSLPVCRWRLCSFLLSNLSELGRAGCCVWNVNAVALKRDCADYRIGMSFTLLFTAAATHRKKFVSRTRMRHLFVEVGVVHLEKLIITCVESLTKQIAHRVPLAQQNRGVVLKHIGIYDSETGIFQALVSTPFSRSCIPKFCSF